MEIITREYKDFIFSTDPCKMDVTAIHDFLSNHSGWCNHIPIARVKKSIEHSLNFGIFHDGRQIGFARVITDYATIAYLGDVYILDAYRGKGLSKQLMDMIMLHPELQGLRRWILLTSTADWLYEKYGFVNLPRPELYMEKYDPEVYTKNIQ
jgi:GNAT superfamily N-acetyltransferase